MDRMAREDILAWIDGLLARDCTVVVVSHDIEPFLPRAARAVTLRDGHGLVLDPLSGDPASRRGAVEGMARPGPGRVTEPPLIRT
jgi:energy-coupling factor transporter ATP-binding protein EcfA2